VNAGAQLGPRGDCYGLLLSNCNVVGIDIRMGVVFSKLISIVCPY
jgi:hypothetical protein